MSEREVRVGVDVGGSGVRAGQVRNGRLVDTPVRFSLESREAACVVQTIVRAVREVAPSGLDAVGIGVPGFVRQGVVRSSPNFPSWHELPLSQLVHQRLKVPVAIENDANAATLGAWDGEHDLVLLTLGTGVGGGVISEGTLLRGADGVAAELGHLFVGGSQQCACGALGCLETWISDTGLRARARGLGHDVARAKDIMDAAERGESWALGLLQDAGAALGRGLGSLLTLFAPQQIKIAGGLSLGSSWLEPSMYAALPSHTIGIHRRFSRVEWLGPADHLAIVGAARAAMR